MISAQNLPAWLENHLAFPWPSDVTVFSVSQRHAANTIPREHLPPDFLIEKHSLASLGMLVVSKVGLAIWGRLHLSGQAGVSPEG